MQHSVDDHQSNSGTATPLRTCAHCINATLPSQSTFCVLSSGLAVAQSMIALMPTRVAGREVGSVRSACMAADTGRPYTSISSIFLQVTWPDSKEPITVDPISCFWGCAREMMHSLSVLGVQCNQCRKEQYQGTFACLCAQGWQNQASGSTIRAQRCCQAHLHCGGSPVSQKVCWVLAGLHDAAHFIALVKCLANHLAT